MNNKNMTGFSLIELMIAVAIVGILAAIAYPSYQDSVRKTHRKDAMAALGGFANAMERWKTQNDTYLGAATGGADTGVPAIFNPRSPQDSAAKYNLSINAATATTFTIRATPIPGGSQASDGIIELNQFGQKAWDQNNNGGFETSENTWGN